MFQWCAFLASSQPLKKFVGKNAEGKDAGGRLQQRRVVFYTSREWRQLCPESGIRSDDRLLCCWANLFLSCLSGAGVKELLQLLVESGGCFWRCEEAERSGCQAAAMVVEARCPPSSSVALPFVSPCRRRSTLSSTSSWSCWLPCSPCWVMCWSAGPWPSTATCRASPTCLWCRWRWPTSQWESWPFPFPLSSASASAPTSMAACSSPASCWFSHRTPSSACWQLPSTVTSQSRYHSGNHSESSGSTEFRSCNYCSGFVNG